MGVSVAGILAAGRSEDPVIAGKPMTMMSRMTTKSPPSAITPPEIRKPAGAGGSGTMCGSPLPGRSGVKDAPHEVQNFFVGSTALPHLGQNGTGYHR